MFAIMHFEKSELIKKMVKDTLMGKNVEYLPAESIEKAYQIINNTKLDLIVTSMMTGNDTIENFIKTINSGINKDTPVFIVTSNELGEDSKWILNLGISDYISKEKLISEISKHIEILLQQHELMNRLRDINIALIDDSALDQAVVKGILNKNGISRVDSYKSGKELFDSGKKHDLYLVDAVLKEEYAKSLIMQLRRNNMNSSIIITSSLSNPKTIAGLIDAGANDFISKPIDDSIFIAKLKSNMRINILMNKIEAK